MRKPDESLDDYVVKPETEIPTVPPSAVALRRTGEVEVLKPLARWEHPAKMVPALNDTLLRPAPPYRLSWFHRSIAVGGGVTMAALVLASAIIIGISDPPAGPDISQLSIAEDQNEFPVYQLPFNRSMPADERLSSDIFDMPKPVAVNSGSRRSRSRWFARQRGLRAADRPQPKPVHTELAVSRFSPTTLVIYIENGAVKTKLEPWTVSFSN